MATAWMKFLIVFLVSFGVLAIVVPMLIQIQLQTMIVMMFLGIAAVIGFISVLHHKKLIGGNHFPFFIGFILMITGFGLVYGSLEFTYGETEKVRYWTLEPSAVTLFALVGIAGFIIMLVGIKHMWNTKGKK